MEYLYNEIKFLWSRSIFIGLEEFKVCCFIIKVSYKKVYVYYNSMF